MTSTSTSRGCGDVRGGRPVTVCVEFSVLGVDFALGPRMLIRSETAFAGKRAAFAEKQLTRFLPAFILPS
jgi:hypothetical protein